MDNIVLIYCEYMMIYLLKPRLKAVNSKYSDQFCLSLFLSVSRFLSISLTLITFLLTLSLPVFLNHTVCPGSSDPFHKASYHIKWVTTSWTHSICLERKLYIHIYLSLRIYGESSIMALILKL